MPSNLQSIVCCLGDPVTGNPTQFLMQRAAGTLGLDWMFVTSEVPEARLNEAFQGIRALRFSGVAFLSPHQQAASLLVDSLTESAIRSGNVRVARRDGESWLGDDTLGMAVAQILCSDSDCVDLMEGTPSSLTRGSLKSDVLCLGHAWMPHLLRLARPDWSPRIYCWNSESEELQCVGAEAFPDQTTKPAITSAIVDTKEVSYSSPPATPSVGCIIIDESAPTLSPKILARVLQNAEQLTVIFVNPNAFWEAALQKPKILSKRIYRTFDVAAAKAAVNFQFWTGHTPEFASIRDSLDEYCQW